MKIMTINLLLMFLKTTLRHKSYVYFRKSNVALNQAHIDQMIGAIEKQESRLQIIVLSGVLTLASTAGHTELVVIPVNIFLTKHLVIIKILHLIIKREVVKQDVNDGVSRV